ncbi:hypothetical protein [Selenomonas sp. oral taxon 920]|uniref:hypothetical protein n=1 Tax=Selenomonas sp. oral taxon 920 TaxID=1884263 RepID=UPI000840D4FC|nr:hypothetical protein [Selenomonas sp. oral taxon 920]AOH49138.1 hypothetical protein BCS37_11580 [Selenomonas sp. oral taxon 920]
MANEKSVIVKSVSLERTAEFEEFVACQKNFSRSIRVLIQQAIFQRGGKIVDIWEEYEKDVQNIVFRNQMNSAPYEEEKSDQRGGSLEETAILDESRHEDPSTSRSLAGSDEKTDNDNGIPEGYQ